MAMAKINYKRKYVRDYGTTSNYYQKRRRFAVRGSYSVPVYKTVNLTAPTGKTEIKFDYGSAQTLIPSTGTVLRVTSIAAGADYNQRIGRLINYYALKGKYYFQQVANSPGYVVTISLVYDLQTNGAIPTVTEIFQSDNPNSLVKATNRNRFKILWQKTHSMAHVNAADQAISWNPMAHGDISVNLKGKKCSFYGPSNNFNDIDSGGLFVVLTTTAGDVTAFNMSEVLSFFE